MACTHTDRPNVLSLPSIGNPHCCRECWDAKPLTAFKGKREAWDHNGYDYQISGGDIYTRTSSGWRTENHQDERTWK